MPIQKWIVTFFGTGLFPKAPGTAGSLAASVMLLIAFGLAGSPVWDVWQVMLIIGLLGACVFSVALGPWAVLHFERKDPQPFVLDEVAGICLTNLFLPISVGWREAIIISAAFVSFRVFDITKPPPARQLEKLPAGWGILLDDLAAAVYANVVCQLFLRLLLHRLM